MFSFKKIITYSLFLLPITLVAQKNPQWVVLVYMTADNDLSIFVERNLEQMMEIGSSDKAIVLVHLDMCPDGGQKITKRFLVLKNQLKQIGEDLIMDSGEGSTLLDALFWADSFNPNHFALVFWNHGSGDINLQLNEKPGSTKKIFNFNPITRKIEIDRRVNYFDADEENKGICFNESTGKYLTDIDLKSALHSFIAERKKLIDVILFDACYMAGIGTAWTLHQVCKYMVASQEVELGTGYDYAKVFDIIHQNIGPAELACHAVNAFGDTYEKSTDDYTHSALDLQCCAQLHDNINVVSALLCEALEEEKYYSALRAIKESKSKFACTCFNAPSYFIDLHHFYTNLLKHLSSITLHDPAKTRLLQKNLRTVLLHGCSLIKQMVIANTTGPNLKHAKGISIYFPDYKMHPSYSSTDFAQNSAWHRFLCSYITKIRTL
jgi:hypothetical protein